MNAQKGYIIAIINNHWVIPENIHIYTMDGILEFRQSGGLLCLEF